MDTGDAPSGNPGKRPCEDDLEMALAADLEVVEEHAQWWRQEPRSQGDAHRSSVTAGVDGAESAWVADERNRVLGQELSPEEGA